MWRISMSIDYIIFASFMMNVATIILTSIIVVLFFVLLIHNYNVCKDNKVVLKELNSKLDRIDNYVILEEVECPSINAQLKKLNNILEAPISSPSKDIKCPISSISMPIKDD